MAAVTRRVAWSKVEPFGVEFVEVAFAGDRLRANGVAINTDPVPYRVDYTIEAGPDFVTTRFEVTTTMQGQQRWLNLNRTFDGDWIVGRGSRGEIMDISQEHPTIPASVLDCDLGLSPFTNTMPVLRGGLLTGEDPIEIVVAWVSVPDLGVHVARQRYSHVRRDGAMSIVRFEDDDGFTADIAFDADGLVVEYPELAQRL